jgi:hypothetical protein
MSWAHVQGTGVQSTSGAVNSLSVSFASSVTAGNLAVSGIATYIPNQDTYCLVSDNKSNTWAEDTPNFLITEASCIGHSVVTTGGTSFTVTWKTDENSGGTSPNASYTSICIDEFSFTGTVSVDSQQTAQTTVSTKTPTVGTALTVTGNDLIYALMEFDLYSAGGTTSFTPMSGFTNAYTAQWNSAGGEGIWAMYELNATSGVDPSWTITSTNTPNTTCCAVAYYTSAAVAVGCAYYPGSSSLKTQRPALRGAQFTEHYC